MRLKKIVLLILILPLLILGCSQALTPDNIESVTPPPSNDLKAGIFYKTITNLGYKDSFLPCTPDKHKKPQENKQVSAEQAKIYQGRLDIIDSSLQIPARAAGVLAPLKLPTEIDGVKITWSSSNPEVINTESGIIKPAAANSNVTLSAVLTYQNLTKNHFFNILVYGTGIQLTDDDILELAAAKLPEKTFPFTPRIIQLSYNENQKTFINGNCVDIKTTITSKSDNVVRDSNNKFVITRDFEDYSVNYKAEISYNGKTKTVKSTIVVPKIVEYIMTRNSEYSPDKVLQTVTFYPGYFEVINESKNSFKDGTRYSYKVKPETKTMYVEKTAYFDIDKWVTREESLWGKVNLY